MAAVLKDALREDANMVLILNNQNARQACPPGICLLTQTNVGRTSMFLLRYPYRWASHNDRPIGDSGNLSILAT